MARFKTISSTNVAIIKNRPGFRVNIVRAIESSRDPGSGSNLPEEARWRFTKDIEKAVCECIASGMTMTEFLKIPGVPPRTLLYEWMGKHESFRNAYNGAKKMRAEFYHDRVLEEAEKVRESNAKAKRVTIDAFKWAAQKGDPDTYGDNKNKDVKEDKPVNIYINTGISREPVKIESTEVKAIDVTQEVDKKEVDKENG